MNPEQIKQEVREKFIQEKCNNCEDMKELPCELRFICSCSCFSDFLLNIIAIKELLIDEVIKEIEGMKISARTVITNIDAQHNATLSMVIQIIKDKLKEK